MTISLHIENEHNFRAALSTGVNLFLGSGFSVLAADTNGEALPVGSAFVSELAQQFGITNADRYDLGRLSTIVARTNRDEFNTYLRGRFTVGHYDERYRALDGLALKTIFTTNIDDLMHKVFSQSSRYYLNDLDLSGPAFRDRLAIDYVAFHGSVVNETRPFRFTTLDIAGAYSARQDRWDYLKRRLEASPTLFLGYSFNDWGTLQTLYEDASGVTHHSDKWIQLRENHEEDEDYFRALGFQIIIGDTSSVLDYFVDISRQESAPVAAVNKPIRDLFPDDAIPDPGTVPVRATLQFYMGSAPTWGDIFSSQIHRTVHYNTIRNVINSGRNAIVVGIPACGKTTLLMQVAAGIDFNGHKLFLETLSQEKSVLIEKRLDGASAIVFVDNFADSIQGVAHLAMLSNVKMVVAERDYNFEIINHRLPAGRFAAPIDITEVSQSDIQQCLDVVPSHMLLRNARNVGRSRNQQLSLFEIIESRMKSPTLRERFRAVLAQLEATDSRLSQLLVMISYVNYCRTPVSMDMILAYLKGQYSDFQEIYDLLRTLGQMVAEHTGTSVIQDQDYYVPRSMLLGTAVMDNCSSDLLREVITNFHKNVSPYRIVEFSTFKRNAFDNGIMIRAFRDEAEGLSFYEEVLASDNSPYTYQHAALYASKMKNFQMAFEWINKALTLSGNRIWSIRNSYAVILFNANFRHFDDAVGRESLRESMAILKACYTADRRKPYHAATYAKQALRLWREYRAQEAWTYLELALSWLQEERVRVPWNWEVRNLLPQVREALDRR